MRTNNLDVAFRTAAGVLLIATLLAGLRKPAPVPEPAPTGIATAGRAGDSRRAASGRNALPHPTPLRPHRRSQRPMRPRPPNLPRYPNRLPPTNPAWSP